MKIIKHKPTYKLDIELTIIPVIYKADIPIDFDAKNNRRKKKLFGVDSHGYLYINVSRAHRLDHRINSVKLRCPICDCLHDTDISLVPMFGSYNRPLADAVKYFLANRLQLYPIRLININKKSAKFFIPIHKECCSTLELNPLPYTAKLQEIAANMDNESFNI